MRVLVIGAGGMVGRKLVDALQAKGLPNGEEIESLTLFDIVAPPPMAGAETLAGDLAGQGTAARLVASRPDLIFHLAAVVSGEAETDFRKGYRVNLDGTRELLDAIRLEGLKQPYQPRLVFTSSIAVFGAPLPDVIPDDQQLTPLTSYGTQKAICELLIADYTRKGLLDGIGIRLPTICVWPGRRRCCRSPTRSGTGTPRRGRRSASSSMPAPWIPPRWARAAASACPDWR